MHVRGVCLFDLVAYAVYRMDQFFLVDGLCQFFAKIFHVGINCSITDNTLIRITDIHELITGKDAAWLRHEATQHFEFDKWQDPGPPRRCDGCEMLPGETKGQTAAHNRFR